MSGTFTELIRETEFGLLLRRISGYRVLQFKEEKSDFDVQEAIKACSTGDEPEAIAEEARAEATRTISRVSGAPSAVRDAPASTLMSEVKRTESSAMEREYSRSSSLDSQIVIGFYGDDDPEFPRNWSGRKKKLHVFLMSLISFVFYFGSSIITPSVGGIMETYNVGYTGAVLGISTYILGYGLGPLIFSPLSEIPSIGRSGMYVWTAFGAFIFQIIACFVHNYHVLMLMRFLTGFMGSQAIAAAPATLNDIYEEAMLPFAVVPWDIAINMAPSLAPLVGGYLAMNLNYMWPMYLFLIMVGTTFLVIFFLSSETLPEAVLTNKVRRMRRLTGNPNITCAPEIKEKEVGDFRIIFNALLKPFLLALDPILFFCNLYLGLAYGTFYLWFEAFPLVYVDMYGFNLGELGLPFLGQVVGTGIAGAVTWVYAEKVVNRKIEREGYLRPEERLLPAVVASLCIPVSLLIFGWSSNPKVHWMVSIVGAAIYVPGLVLLFQCLMVYLPIIYPGNEASVLAMNGAARSMFGFAFPLFAYQMYDAMGVDWGCTMLAIVSAILTCLFYLLYRNGEKLRRASKYTYYAPELEEKAVETRRSADAERGVEA